MRVGDRFSMRLLQRAIACNELFKFLTATIAVCLVNFLVTNDIFTRSNKTLTIERLLYSIGVVINRSNSQFYPIVLIIAPIRTNLGNRISD